MLIVERLQSLAEGGQEECEGDPELRHVVTYRHEMALISLLLSHLGPAEQDAVATLTSSTTSSTAATTPAAAANSTYNTACSLQHQALSTSTLSTSATVGQQVETHLKNVQ